MQIFVSLRLVGLHREFYVSQVSVMPGKQNNNNKRKKTQTNKQKGIRRVGSRIIVEGALVDPE